jgi:hypothetical protein
VKVQLVGQKSGSEFLEYIISKFIGLQFSRARSGNRLQEQDFRTLRTRSFQGERNVTRIRGLKKSNSLL